MKSGMGKLLTFIMAAFLLVFAGYHAYTALPLRGGFFGRKKAWTSPRAATCAMRCVMAKRCGWAACWPTGTAMP